MIVLEFYYPLEDLDQTFACTSCYGAIEVIDSDLFVVLNDNGDREDLYYTCPICYVHRKIDMTSIPVAAYVCKFAGGREVPDNFTGDGAIRCPDCLGVDQSSAMGCMTCLNRKKVLRKNGQYLAYPPDTIVAPTQKLCDNCNSRGYFLNTNDATFPYMCKKCGGIGVIDK